MLGQFRVYILCNTLILMHICLQIRTGMVQVSDGKSRPRPARLVLTMEAVTVQLEMPVPIQPPRDKTVPHARVGYINF